MIRFFSLLVFTVLSLALSAATDSSEQLANSGSKAFPPTFFLFPKRTAKLDAGTIVFFETTSSLNSRDVTVGTMVPFRVVTNVMAEKHAVITSGTQALGRIIKITKATFNSPEVVEIEVKHVQAIDGTQVLLSANPVRIRGTYPGQGFEVEPYRSATAMVMNHVEIELK